MRRIAALSIGVLLPVIMAATCLFGSAAAATTTTYSISPASTAITGKSTAPGKTCRLCLVFPAQGQVVEITCASAVLQGKTPATTGDLTIQLSSETFGGCTVLGNSSYPARVLASDTATMVLGRPPSKSINTDIANLSLTITYNGWPTAGDSCTIVANGSIPSNYDNDGTLKIRQVKGDTGQLGVQGATSGCSIQSTWVYVQPATFKFTPVFKEVAST
jgi:hypothetical protein